MTYRTFARPDSTGWTTKNWTHWTTTQRLLLDVHDQTVEPVCATCWGGTKKDFNSETLVRRPDGLMTFQTELTRWPRCYNCSKIGGLAGVVPISYSLHDRLESAIWRAKNDVNHQWLNTALASVLHTFLVRHFSCIEAVWGHIDIIAPIPSHSSARSGWDHMQYMLTRVRTWPAPDRWNHHLLTKSGTSDAAGRRTGQPIQGLFGLSQPTPDLDGKQVLLVDDTYTTGGTLRSAAVPIQDAGGRRPVVVTIGRQIRRDAWGDYVVDEALARSPLYDPTKCAVHSA